MIITRTPFRVSFFGGGTDFPEWFNNHGGKVLSTSIDKYCYILCRNLPPFFEYNYRIVWSKSEMVKNISEIQHPIVREALIFLKDNDAYEIIHNADLPARSGLGSSSSFAVGLLNALYATKGKMIENTRLAKEAIHIEKYLIKETVGFQDQIAASYGGFNKITFMPNDSFKVEPVILTKNRLEEFQANLMLFFTGFSRHSSDVAIKQLNNIAFNSKILSELSVYVDEAISLLQASGPISDFGKLLDESWTLKKSLSDVITSDEIDLIYTMAKKNGALGGKILGAGGGGFLLLFVPRESQPKVRKALESLTYVPFSFEDSGSKVVLYQPSGLENN
jgi:D-glycero-alpha-D-manno-heptose-7-phosphate kinase